MTKIIIGVNDLLTTHPQLISEWDYEKNINVSPLSITAGSNKKVWWKCKIGHSFEASPTTRVGMNTGCPYCSNKRVLRGYNDLLTTNPTLALDWDYEKNNVLPSDVCAGTGKTIWWKCRSCGGSWQAKGADRNRGVGCPYCSNKKVLAGKNDLLSTNPFLAKEWAYDKNSGLRPDMFVEGSKVKAWWQCSVCGHKWLATIDDRSRGRGCPSCYKRMQTSFPEQAILYYIKANYPDAINGYTDIFDTTMEIDVYIPSIQLGIEYDGVAWHNSELSKQREAKKYSICKKHGITLIRIKEGAASNSKNCDILIPALSDLNHAILQLEQYIHVGDVDIIRDRKKIMQSYYSVLKNNSLAEKYPHIAIEWDCERNGKLHPNMFFPFSSEKVWWRCSKNHAYESSIAHRIEGKGCPYWASKKILLGFNDLASQSPEIAAEWDYKKNFPLVPSMVTSKSNKMIWWLCSKGHSWKAKPLHRQRGGCPVCGGKQVKIGENDFQSNYPDLAQEWDYLLNDGKKPCDFTSGSNQKVWWKCKKCGRSWHATIYSRSSGTGCPNCSKKAAAQERAVMITCVETKTTYSSITLAAQETGIDRRKISACINGRQNTAGGFHWEKK